uniref:Uncharacterized protein n=1 Tax=Leersia perrieri TaxID=77586 RepID=A0A0D9XJ40_9ORYZ
MADLAVGAVGALIRKLAGRQLRSRGGVLPEEAQQFLIMQMKVVEEIIRELEKLPPDLFHEHVKIWAHKAIDVPYMTEDLLHDPNFLDHLDGMVREMIMVLNMVNELHRIYMGNPSFIRDSMVSGDPRLSDSYYRDSTELVGIDEPCCQLIKMLTEGQATTKQRMEVISIVGFAGLGKTSLAKLVYQKLKAQFDCAAFVSVSPEANMKAIFTDMLHQLDRESGSHAHEEITSDQTKLAAAETRTLLENKRYFIVIDDLWNIEDWNNILLSLPNNDCGSRVITTTRISDVAKACCSGRDEFIYQMKNLGDIYARRLFMKIFIGSEDSFPDAGLTKVVDDILNICGGMPLAIITVASLFGREVGAKEPLHEMANSLQSVWRKMMWYLNSGCEHHDLENLRNVVSLSYFHLSSNNVRACLRYLASCTQSHRIERRKWAKKWISNEFIPQGESQGTSDEEVATQYFGELINCNVIRPVKYDDSIEGDTYEFSCMMLYVLRLISHESHSVAFLSDSVMGNSDSEPWLPSDREWTTRLMSIQCSDNSESWLNNLSLFHVHSLTVHGFAKPILRKYLTYLRVLDIDGCNDLDNTDMDNICQMTLLKHLSLKKTQITALPPKVQELTRLETLDVSQNEITALPPEIGNLMSLKTLEVSRTELTALPPETGKLTSLKTLDVSRTQITALPPEIGDLTNLETLDVSRTKIKALPREIGGLTNLETLDARKTPLRELPKEFLRLLRLRSLLFGQSNLHEGVKLPAGSNQLRSVKVLSAIDSRECSTSVLEELCKLKELSDLAIVLHDGPNDKEKTDNLLVSIGKIPNLKSLTIYGDSHFTDPFQEKGSNSSDETPLEQDFNPSDETPASRCFPALKELKVPGRFVKVPGWIAQLTAVTILEIRVCRLDEEMKDLEILGNMTNLRGLVLSLLVALPRKQLTISSSAKFTSLEAFTFDCRAPWVTFEVGAMPRLKHLQLRLYAGPEGKIPSGIVHLTNLRKVSLRYLSQYTGSACISQTIDAMKEEAANHPNLITIFVNGAQEFFPFKETAVI